MGNNTIKTTRQQLLIHLEHPTRERLLDAKTALQQWDPDLNANVCINMTLLGTYFSLMLRVMLLKTVAIEKFQNKHLSFDITFYQATQQSLQQLFKPTDNMKKFPAHLSFFCDALTSAEIWVQAIARACDDELFSEQTKFYLRFPLSPEHKAILDSRAIVYEVIEAPPPLLDHSITQEPALHPVKQPALDDEHKKDEHNRNVPHNTISDAVQALHPLELNICFDAQAFLDEAAIVQAFEAWNPIRGAQFILSIKGLNTHWGDALRRLLVSETCQTLQARNIGFTLTFQQASDPGLEALFSDHEKKFPKKLIFICDNTTHTESWYDAIVDAIAHQRFSESTAFNMSFHKFSQSRVYALKNILDNPACPKHLKITYHVGRSHIKTITSSDQSQHVFFQAIQGPLATIIEQDEHDTDEDDAELKADVGQEKNTSHI